MRIAFLIIGPQGSGSTIPHHWPGQHPSPYLPEQEDIAHVWRDELCQQGPEQRHSSCRSYSGQPVVGNGNVHVMCFSDVMGGIYDDPPQVRPVAALRNPMGCAYSAYWYARRNPSEEYAESFEEAIGHERQQSTGSPGEHCGTYLSHDHCAGQLERVVGKCERDRPHNRRLEEQPRSALAWDTTRLTTSLDWFRSRKSDTWASPHPRSGPSRTVQQRSRGASQRPKAA